MSLLVLLLAFSAARRAIAVKPPAPGSGPRPLPPGRCSFPCARTRRAAVDGQLTTTSQCHAVDRSHYRHLRITDAQHQVLQLALDAVDGIGATDQEGRAWWLPKSAPTLNGASPDQITMPWKSCSAVSTSFHQALHDFGADGVHLVLDAGDQDLAIQRPGAQRLGFQTRWCQLSSNLAGYVHPAVFQGKAVFVDGSIRGALPISCIAQSSTSLRRCAHRQPAPPGLQTPTGQRRLAQRLPASMSS